MSSYKKTIILIYLILQILTVTAYAQIEKGGYGTSSAVDTGKTWAVIVGISKYKNIRGLNYADKDASAFYDYLVNTTNGPKLDASRVKLLLNENALSTEIYGALDWLKESVKANDRVIFYFSGHGDVEKKAANQDGFLLAYNSPIAAYMTSGAVSIKYLQEYLKAYIVSNKAKDVILIVDACRSGLLAGGAEGAELTRQALVQNPNKQIIKILSAQENEFSVEGTKWGGGRGVFSYYLIKGIEGLANRNNHKFITTADLAAYLPLAVSDATGNVQHPEIDGNPTAELFAVDQKTLSHFVRGEMPAPLANGTLGTGITEELAPDIQRDYKKYQLYLSKGQLVVDPADGDSINCAKHIYFQLINRQGAESIRASLKSSFFAALQRKMQDNLDNYLNDQQGKNNGTETYYEIACLRRIADPDYVLRNDMMAKCYLMEGLYCRNHHNNKLWIELLRKALQFEPDAPYTSELLAQYFNFSGQADSAIYYYQKAISVAPKWAYPYNNMANIYRGMKVYDKAILNYQMAVQLDTGYTMPYCNIGSVYLELKEYEKAIPYYQKAITKDSTVFDYYENLGAAYVYLKKYQMGIANMKKAITLSPGNVDAYYNLACAYSLSNDFDNGLVYLKKAIEKGFNDFEYIMQDDDMQNLRKTAGFTPLMKLYFPDKVK